MRIKKRCLLCGKIEDRIEKAYGSAYWNGPIEYVTVCKVCFKSGKRELKN